jgi:HAD superfamily hydrolase (TIGR01549 family)
MRKLDCVIFDLDNTLVESDLDFDQIKREIGTSMPILEYRDEADEAEKARVDDILERHEARAASNCTFLSGARELLEFLEERGVAKALLTRNTQRTIAHVCGRLGMRFDIALSREDSEPKPSPRPVLHICQALGAAPERTLVVGDYLYDMLAGERAGAMTMLVDSHNRGRFVYEPDYEVADLAEARPVIEALLSHSEVNP